MQLRLLSFMVQPTMGTMGTMGEDAMEGQLGVEEMEDVAEVLDAVGPGAGVDVVDVEDEQTMIILSSF